MGSMYSSRLSAIGITGAFGSGKSTAAKFFESKGFRIISLSSFLEEEAKRRNLSITRKNLQDLGNEIRQKEGAGILVKKALKSQKLNEKIVIDGIRNIEEINELRKKPNSIILAIVADRKVRFDRLKNLKRREKLTKDLFIELDLRDLGINEKITGLQTAFCIALADVFIDSNGTLEDFNKDLEIFLDKYEESLKSKFPLS